MEIAAFFCQVMKNHFSRKEIRNLKSFIFCFPLFQKSLLNILRTFCFVSFLFKNSTLTLQYLKSLKELTRQKCFHLPETELLPTFLGVPDSKIHTDMQEPVFTSMWANARDNSYHDCCSGQHRSPCLQFIPHTANSWPFSSSSLIICHLFILSFLNRNKILDLGIIAFVCLLHLSLIMLTVSPLLLPLSRYRPSNSSPITVYSFPTLFFPSPPLLIVIS